MDTGNLIDQFGGEKTSAYRRYCQMFVGREGLWALARYELTTGILGSMPGALGYLMRSRLYPRLMQSCGPGSMFGRGVTLRSPGRMRLGRGVIVDDYSVLDAKGDRTTFEIGDQIFISRGCILTCRDASFRMGNHVSIGPYCQFSAPLQIGSNVSIGSGSRILGSGHAHDDPETPVILQEATWGGAIIEDGVWIGAGVTVLEGSLIRRNAIIGAGAVVRGEIPAYAVAAGLPAKVLYDRRERAARRGPAKTS